MSLVHSHEETLPRGALIIAGALVVFSLGITATMRIAQVPPSASPVLLRAQNDVAPVASRNLRFSDRADGAVVITDVDTGKVATVIEPGSQSGFIRAVMRGLARDRRMRGIGADAPFKLTAWKDGELSLVDSVSNRATEMTAFGTTNRAAFAALLTSKEVAE